MIAQDATKVHGPRAYVGFDGQYGLSSAVFTRDKELDLTFALDLHAGMTHIDDSSVDDTVTGPLGESSGNRAVRRRVDHP